LRLRAYSLSDIVQVTDIDVLDRMLEDWDYVVINFSAPAWCVPCRRLAPHYLAAVSKLPGVVFVEVDIDKVNEPFINKYSLMSVPTLKFYSMGEFVSDLKSRTSVPLITEIKELVK